MCPGNDNQIDWSAAATPSGERARPGLSPAKPPRVVPQSKRSVMDTLLGKNNLAAQDVGGIDPYNATGRHFRR
jgi:hypothetical protein